MQHRDPVRHRQDVVDVVLDQQNGVRSGEALDQFAHDLAVEELPASLGQRLVE